MNIIFDRKIRLKDHKISTNSLQMIIVFYCFFRDYTFLSHLGVSVCGEGEEILQVVVSWGVAPTLPISVRKFLFLPQSRGLYLNLPVVFIFHDLTLKHMQRGATTLSFCIKHIMLYNFHFQNDEGMDHDIGRKVLA